MSARSTSPLGFGLYFIDVLACLLFCITLALVGARFGRETSIPIDLPRLEGDGPGAELSAPSIALRSEAGELRLFFDGEPLDFAQLAERLERDPPPSVVVRAEVSPLSRVIGIAHDAGVRDIALAYEVARGGGEP